MPGALAGFQDRMLAALLAAPGDAGDGGPLATLALRVHRNTVRTALIDALAANSPSVAADLGAEAFRGASQDYAPRPPPTDSRLVVYGGGFPDYLESAGAARAAVFARLDRAWIEAQLASDAEPLFAARLADADVGWLSDLRVAPHPAARWLPVEARMAVAWAEARGLSLVAPPLESDGALPLSRLRGIVVAAPISPALARLLDAFATESRLLTAAVGALSTDPDFDLTAGFARLLAAGALVPASQTGTDP